MTRPEGTAVDLIGHLSNHLPALERAVAQPCRQPETRFQGSTSLTILSPDQVDDLVDGYLQGDTAPELAARFDVDEATVYAHLKRRSVPRRVYRKLHRGLLEVAITM